MVSLATKKLPFSELKDSWACEDGQVNCKEEIIALDAEKENNSNVEILSVVKKKHDFIDDINLKNDNFSKSNRNLEDLYTRLIYMVQHQIGFDEAGITSQDTTIKYLQKTFQIDDETHVRVLGETRQMKPPEMHLKIRVIEAKELTPMDSTGLSDPFCILYLESASTTRCNTSVRLETLAPVWEENFELFSNDPENDVLHVEVWDFDASETMPEKLRQVTNIKGFQGFTKFVKEIAQTDGSERNEFIGSIHIPFKEIPSALSPTGNAKWYKLGKKNRSKNHGSIKLQLDFGAKHNSQVVFKEHCQLLKMLLLYELGQNSCWAVEKWSEPAKVLQVQHTVQSGLSYKHVSLSKWIEFGEILHQQEHSFDFRIFLLLASELLESIENQKNFTDEEVELFWDATKKIFFVGLKILRIGRRVPETEDDTVKQLHAVIGTITVLLRLKGPKNVNLFPLKMYSWFPAEISDDYRVSILNALEFAVIQCATERFEYITADHNSLAYDSDEELLGLRVKIVEDVTIDLVQAMKQFTKNINIFYPKTLYLSYGKNITDLCMLVVEDVCLKLEETDEEPSENSELNLEKTLFKLYLAIQKFYDFGKNLCTEDELKSAKLTSYHEWFKIGVAHCLEVMFDKVNKQIVRAIELDNLEAIDSSVQYSSSAVDTIGIFSQITVFWNNLAWPDVIGAKEFTSKIVENTCQCCLRYVDAISQNGNESINQQEKYKVSKVLCTVINNTEYVKNSIDSVLDDIVNKKNQQCDGSCKSTQQLVIDTSKNTIKTRITDMLDGIVRKMFPSITKYLMEGSELSDTSSNYMDELLEYLDSNLIILHDDLTEDNFKRILKIIWDLMTETLHEILDNNLKMKMKPSYYSNLHKSLKTLIQFFNLGAEELPEALEKIENLLMLQGLESSELVHQYYKDRFKEQMIISSESAVADGMLTIKAYFYNDMLNLEILNARHLKSLYKNGKCDTFVTISLSPVNEFTSIEKYKTSVQKNTQFPLYEESFGIQLTPEQRKAEDAILIFEIKHKDLLKTRFLAECFLPFSRIPEISSPDAVNELDQLHLKLSRPTSQSSEVVGVLSKRKNDDLASDFVSKIKSKTTPFEKRGLFDTRFVMICFQ